MRFVVYESQTPRFALYGPTKNKGIVKSVRRFSSDTLKLCDLLANIDLGIADRQRQKHATFSFSRFNVEFNETVTDAFSNNSSFIAN